VSGKSIANCLAVCFIGLAIGILAVSIANYFNPAQATEADRYKGRGYAAEVKRHVDGDTMVVDIDLGLGVWLKDQHLRLNRVDTPERGEPDYDAATRVAQTACPVETTADLVIPGKDKYGRWLAEITCRGVNLNDRLIQRGWKYEK